MITCVDRCSIFGVLLNYSYGMGVDGLLWYGTNTQYITAAQIPADCEQCEFLITGEMMLNPATNMPTSEKPGRNILK